MPDRLGNAALIWSATSDASGQRVHLLQAPLRSIRAGHSMQTFQRQSLDRSVLENVSVGDGSAELRGRVRYDHDPVGLSDAIVAGSQGKTLRYIPDLTDPDVDFQCDLVAPLAPFGLDLDQQRGVLGDQSVELVLRQTDQASFDPLYHGSAVLFSYRAGGSLEASSSFGRITSSSAPATYADINEGGGFGSLSTALSNQARIHWMTSPGSCGPREFPTLLLEDDRENLIDEAIDFGQWTLNNNVARSSAQVSPSGSTDAWLLTSSSAAARGYVSRDSTFGASTQRVLSVFAKPNDSTQSLAELRSSDGTVVIDMQINWSSGEPSMSLVSAGSSITAEERWRDGFWRIQAVSTADLSAGVYTTRLYPAASGTNDSAYFYGAQVE